MSQKSYFLDSHMALKLSKTKRVQHTVICSDFTLLGHFVNITLNIKIYKYYKYLKIMTYPSENTRSFHFTNYKNVCHVAPSSHLTSLRQRL